MTYEQVQQLCPKADRVTLTNDGTVGLKVGEFSQAINVNFQKGHEEASRQIKSLYLDLLAMGRETEAQIREAKAQNGR